MQAKDKSREGESERSNESQLPSLSSDQLEVLRKFALFETGLKELLQSLEGVFEFNPEPRTAVGSAIHRSAKTQFRLPEPGIVITRDHISNALERKRFELITERDLALWATILLMNDAYSLDPGDEDLIADWLNDISFNLGDS
jgi:hypothetical protein